MGYQTSPNFVTSDSSVLLDLICTRYPGRRPSDYYGDLSDYEAFQLDGAMALKGKAADNDYNQMMLWSILEAVRGVIATLGGKPKKLPKPKPTIQTKVEDREPTVEEVLAALGGAGTIINIEK